MSESTVKRRKATSPSSDPLNVHVLPNEILELIFRLGSSNDAREWDQDQVDPSKPLFSSRLARTHFPDAVSQVCHRWRELALRTNSLWTVLVLSLPSRHMYSQCRTRHGGACGRASDSEPRARCPKPKNSKPHSIGAPCGRNECDCRKRQFGLVQWLHRQVGRAKDAPLDITIDCRHDNVLLESATPFITKYCSRFQSLTLLVSHVGNLGGTLTLLSCILQNRNQNRNQNQDQNQNQNQNRAPLALLALEHLAIYADIYREGILSAVSIPPFFLDATRAPRLQTLSLNRVYLSWNEAKLPRGVAGAGPGAGAGTGMGTGTGAGAGAGSPSLTSMQLSFCSRWPDLDQLRAIGSRGLQKLVLRDDFSTVLSNLLPPALKDSLDPLVGLPCLKELEVCPYHWPRRVAFGNGCRHPAEHEYEYEYETVGQLLCLLDTPVLDTLVLRGLQKTEWECMIGYLGYVGRRYESVRHLVLEDVNLDWSGSGSGSGETEIEIESEPSMSVQGHVPDVFPNLLRLTLVRVSSEPFLSVMLQHQDEGEGEANERRRVQPAWCQLRALSISGDPKLSLSSPLLQKVVQSREEFGKRGRVRWSGGAYHLSFFKHSVSMLRVDDEV